MKKATNIFKSLVHPRIILLGILLLLILVTAGLMIKEQNLNSRLLLTEKKELNRTSQEHQAAPSGWKTFESSYQNISFNYPANWSIIEQPLAGAPKDAKSIVLASPDNFTLIYDDQVTSSAGECLLQSPNAVLTSSSKLSSANSNIGLYIVQSGDQIALDSSSSQVSAGNTGSCQFDPRITSQSQPGDYMLFASSASFQDGTPPSITSSESADLRIAESILSSFKFLSS